MFVVTAVAPAFTSFVLSFSLASAAQLSRFLVVRLTLFFSLEPRTDPVNAFGFSFFGFFLFAFSNGCPFSLRHYLWSPETKRKTFSSSSPLEIFPFLKLLGLFANVVSLL